jgi:hypothetical protein
LRRQLGAAANAGPLPGYLPLKNQDGVRPRTVGEQVTQYRRGEVEGNVTDYRAGWWWCVAKNVALRDTNVRPDAPAEAAYLGTVDLDTFHGPLQAGQWTGESAVSGPPFHDGSRRLCDQLDDPCYDYGIVKGVLAQFVRAGL